jgi:heptosyltransferase-2
MRILVIQTASIGDVILATPVLEQLHRGFPDAKIDLLVKKGQESLFDYHPFLNELLIWDKKSGKYKNLFVLLMRIRKHRYDCVINIQRFASTGILAGLSGATARIGFSKNPFSFLYTKKVEHSIGVGVHEVERNLSLIVDLVSVNEDLQPKLYPTTGNYTKAASLALKNYYTISPASLWFTKQYPAEGWAKLVREIPIEYSVFLLGSGSDVGMCNQIISSSGRPAIVNLAGSLTFLESAALMKGAVMNFTNDSAPMHLCSAVNAPVTAIFCSTIPGFGFGPLSDQRHIVETSEPIECRPCGLHGFNACPKGHFNCAMEIKTRQLTELL